MAEGIILVFVILIIISIGVGVHSSEKSKKRDINQKKAFDSYLNSSMNVSDNKPEYFYSDIDLKSKRSESIYFDVVDVDNRSKSARKTAAELAMNDQLELEVDFSKKKDRIRVLSDGKWIGYVEDGFTEEVKNVILHGNNNYECLVVSAFAEWDDDITDAGNIIEFVADVDITAELQYEKFEKTINPAVNKNAKSSEPVKNYSNYFDQYYDLYKDLDYEELEEALNVDNKENYADYTDEEKQRWRAVKVLMEEIENNNFRNYFINKEFLKETDSGALKYKIQQIDFRENFNKMEAIPEIIKGEADKHAELLAENELIDKLKTKTFKQLYNYYDKRGVSSFSEKLQNYYHFRDKYLVKENILKRDIEKIKNISMRADDEQTMRATRADMHKMEGDLKWIMEGFFDLSEEEQKSFPEKEFFKSTYL